MLRGSVTTSLIGYVLLMLVNEFGQLLIGISSLLEKISRGLYYERMKLSYICTAEKPLWLHDGRSGLTLNDGTILNLI